jgi:hypothetical protein
MNTSTPCDTASVKDPEIPIQQGVEEMQIMEAMNDALIIGPKNTKVKRHQDVVVVD